MALSKVINTIKQMIKDLAKHEELYVPVRNLAIGAGLGALSVRVGMLFGGLPGILAGAAVGGVCLACLNGGVQPLSDYLERLPPEKQEMLYNGVMDLLKGAILKGSDFLLERVLEDTKLKNSIVFYIKSFFEGTLQIKVVQKKELIKSS